MLSQLFGVANPDIPLFQVLSFPSPPNKPYNIGWLFYLEKKKRVDIKVQSENSKNCTTRIKCIV
jgi:hypothetical protein